MSIRVRPLLTACAAVALLGACDSTFATNWVPVGYTYQDDSPITTPAPSKPWLNDAVITSTDGISASNAAWQGAVFELVDKLAPTVPPGPITLVARPPQSAQKQAFDHHLRQTLTQRGYTIATTGSGGPTLTYDVMSLTNKAARDWAVAKLGAQAVPGAEVADANMKDVFLLRATTASPLIADEAVVAVLSGEKREYSRWSGYTNQPVQGKALTKTPIYESRD